MFVKATYTVEGISFDNYARAWDCLMARKYPDIVLFDRDGNIVHSCEIARAFIIHNQEEREFVEEYLSYAGIQDEVYNCGVSEVTKDSIIMPDYNDEYCMFVKKMIKKNGTTPNFVLNAFYYENCPLRQYYKI